MTNLTGPGDTKENRNQKGTPTSSSSIVNPYLLEHDHIGKTFQHVCCSSICCLPKKPPTDTKKPPEMYQKPPKCTKQPCFDQKKTPIDVAGIDPHISYIDHQKHPLYLVVETCGSHAPTGLQAHSPIPSHTLLLHPIAEACPSETPSQPCVHLHPLNMSQAPSQTPCPNNSHKPAPALSNIPTQDSNSPPVPAAYKPCSPATRIQRAM